LIDTQRLELKIIPNTLVDFIDECNKYSYNDILKKFNKQKDIIQEYADFLLENEYCFFTSESTSFPKMKLDWNFPSQISNAIVDINNLNNIYIEELIKQLDDINCFHLQLRFLRKISTNDLLAVLECTKKFNFRTINLVLDSFSINNENTFIDNICKYDNIYEIIIYNSDIENRQQLSTKLMGEIKKIKENILSKNECGKIKKKYFSPNILSISESQCHNTCLNRKIGIDTNGEIKNCPSCSKSYGNIKNTTLAEAIEKPGFKDLWYITKDKIDVCKDCEFRHICTDCRVYIKDPDNIYSQPSKCTYNPYIAKWEGEESYVPVEECGTYSRETGFIPNKRKINKLNNTIWGE
jgi:SPASM domain peptide maturase of grasp-with-spasm system